MALRWLLRIILPPLPAFHVVTSPELHQVKPRRAHRGALSAQRSRSHALGVRTLDHRPSVCSIRTVTA